jgi:hypothetical protein
VAAGSIPPLLANSGKQTSMERLSLFDTLMFNPAEVGTTFCACHTLTCHAVLPSSVL